MYNPEPKFERERVPKQIPTSVVPSLIREDGIVGDWLFYNGAGGKLFDFSGYGNHGSISGAKWVDGPWGWSLEFDKVDDYAQVPNDASLNPANVTMGGWVYVETLDGTWQGIMEKRCSDETPYHGFSITNENEIEAAVTVGGTRYTIHWANPEADTWYFFTVTYDGETVYLFVNADQKASDTSPSGDLDALDCPLNMGVDDLGHESYFGGKIAWLFMYSNAKPQSWISTFFQHTRGIFGV